MPPFEGCCATCFFPVWGKSAKGTILFFFFFSFLSGRGEKPSGIVEPTSSFIHYAETKVGRKKRRCVSPFLRVCARGLCIVCMCV
uniref:Putative secreted protein n=1 Tax=Ixodes ricinus TaxID=34613 RepID=A0A147BRY0_IXORI